MKLSLDINEQNALLEALLGMDAHEVVVEVGGETKIVRQPYKLGSDRRILVRNTRTLKVSLNGFEEARFALVREHWPDLAEGASLSQKDDPDGFRRYNADLTKIVLTKEPIELEPFPAAVIYKANEFPLSVAETLDRHGLIEG